MSSETSHNNALIPPAAVAEMYGIHEKSVSRFVAAGRIPKPVERRHRYTRWSRAEIQQDIANKCQRAKAEAAS